MLCCMDTVLGVEKNQVQGTTDDSPYLFAVESYCPQSNHASYYKDHCLKAKNSKQV